MGVYGDTLQLLTDWLTNMRLKLCGEVLRGARWPNQQQQPATGAHSLIGGVNWHDWISIGVIMLSVIKIAIQYLALPAAAEVWQRVSSRMVIKIRWHYKIEQFKYIIGVCVAGPILYMFRRGEWWVSFTSLWTRINGPTSTIDKLWMAGDWRGSSGGGSVAFYTGCHGVRCRCS